MVPFASPHPFASPQWILDNLATWLDDQELTVEDLARDEAWIYFVNQLDKIALNTIDKLTPQQWFEYRENIAVVDQARRSGELAKHLPPSLRYRKEEEETSGILDEAEKLINPTLLEKYKVALRLQKYEEAGELWKQMSEAEHEQARTFASHRRAMRKFAFNDMLGKGWDSGKQFSFCMQRSLAGDPQFWWVPEVVRKFPVPPPNWESVKREPDGRFKEFPGRGKGKKKKEKKSSARAELCKFALNLYFKQHPEEGRRILSLLREIK